MEQILVESNKSYYHGFVLKEPELRRIIDLVNEQFKKLPAGDVLYTFKMKFENGAIATTNNIESVIKQENEGSAAIVRLELQGKHIAESKESFIELDFRNIDSKNESGDVPIKHIITGQSRDWVFITSSLIEERIVKIKRKALDQIGERGTGRLFFKLLSPILMLLFTIAMMYGLPNSIEDATQKKLKYLEDIELQWKNQTLTDPVQTILLIQKFDAKEKDNLNPTDLIGKMFLTKPIIALFVVLIFLVTSFYFISKYYPAYNFAWGGYLETFNKKESNRKLVVGLIVGTILIGILVNLLSNYIWEKL